MTHDELMALSERSTQGQWLCADGPSPYQHRVSAPDGVMFQPICDVFYSGDGGLIAAAVNFLRSPEFRAMREDAERYRWLRDSKWCSFALSFNDHHNAYQTVAETLKDSARDPNADYYRDCPPAEREKMIATDTIWTLHIYPNTPIGFNVYHAATLDAAIDAARDTGNTAKVDNAAKVQGAEGEA